MTAHFATIWESLADREKKIKNELNTQFRIGSMNKMFTAVCALELVESGKLKLTGTVGEYLPDYPNSEVASKVKLRQNSDRPGCVLLHPSPAPARQRW